MPIIAFDYLLDHLRVDGQPLYVQALRLREEKQLANFGVSRTNRSCGTSITVEFDWTDVPAPAIKAGRHTLIAAPTGSGKTLAAFLAAIDGLVRQGLKAPLKDETQIVYVSPLKALSNDIHRNLEAPLTGIRRELRAQGLPDVDIRTWVRTGDTPAAERQRMNRLPPHIVVTTPESLYILLGSASGRAARP